MPDILLAADEPAATTLIHDAETALGVLSRTGASALGPFNVNWNASATVSGGAIDLIAPDIVRIADVRVDYHIGFTVSVDLNNFLPHFCLPQVCIRIPFIGRVCTPRICVDWPTISVPIGFGDFVRFTADFRPVVTLSAGVWKIDIVIVGVPSLQLGAASILLIAAIGAALSLAMLGIPFIGPFLAGAVLAITAFIGVAGATGLLGPILTLFIAGMSFNIYNQPRVFEVLPSGGPVDPPVHINLDAIAASVQSTDKDELVVTVDISP